MREGLRMPRSVIERQVRLVYKSLPLPKSRPGRQAYRNRQDAAVEWLAVPSGRSEKPAPRQPVTLAGSEAMLLEKTSGSKFFPGYGRPLPCWERFESARLH